MAAHLSAAFTARGSNRSLISLNARPLGRLAIGHRFTAHHETLCAKVVMAHTAVPGAGALAALASNLVTNVANQLPANSSFTLMLRLGFHDLLPDDHLMLGAPIFHRVLTRETAHLL